MRLIKADLIAEALPIFGLQNVANDDLLRRSTEEHDARADQKGRESEKRSGRTRRLTLCAMEATASSKKAGATRSTLVAGGRTSGGRARCRRLGKSGINSFDQETRGG
jgi:hypothetical protein